jgi:hypothetical protein
MSFNSLMALLVRSTLDHLEPHPTVLELGNQTLRADDRTLRHVLEHSRDRSDVDAKGLERLIAEGSDGRRERAADYYRLLGFADYVAIDVNDRYGSLVMDLNRDLVRDYDYRETFQLVTNNGTGEHVFNQDAIYRNVHQLTVPGGLMLHVMPFYEFVNHGFFAIQPNLYPALARANDYRLLALGVATRAGRGIVARSDDGPGPMLREESRVPLSVLLSEAKAKRPGVKGLLKRFAGKPEARRFGRLLRGLQHETPNLLCFSLLRKQHDRPFQTPIQGIYEDDVDDLLRPDYDLDTSQVEPEGVSA